MIMSQALSVAKQVSNGIVNYGSLHDVAIYLRLNSGPDLD